MNVDRYKFRAWFYDGVDVSTGQMESFETCVQEGYVIFEENQIKATDECTILMQCTGLKDSQGNLIYESDIITFMPSEGVPPDGGSSWVRLELAFDDDYADYYFVNPPAWMKENSFFSMIENCNYYRVEGNRFEHPELLEAGK